MAGEKEKVATAWLSNQAVIYAILGIVGVIALITFVSYARVWFSHLVDSILGFFQGFLPKPQSQQTDQRSLVDDVTGLAYANQGDRALSDLADSNPALLLTTGGLLGGYGGASVLPDDIAARAAQYKAAGWLDSNGNLTASGKLAASQGLMAAAGS
jgi:hypothetical protein